jgi:hypothetical protein
VLGLNGKVGAVSLHVWVFRPDGSLAYEGVGGLDLIQEARRDERGGRPSFVLREDPFSDRDHLREGVARAFERSVGGASRSG